MGGRLIGLLGLVAAIVLAAQLRGSLITAPTPRSIAALLAFVVGVVLLAGVLGNNLRRKRRPAFTAALEDNRRQTFRIPYPPEERPQLKLSPPLEPTPEWLVLDLSEEGLRCQRELDTPLSGEVAGELQFRDGRRAQVAGSVVRCDGHEVCLHLHRTVPPDLVVEEQLRLRQHLRPSPQTPAAADEA